jgi:branched-chain amino acid transport system substrate-binding protein
VEYKYLLIRKAALTLVVGTAFLFLSCQSTSMLFKGRRPELSQDRDLYTIAKADLQAGQYEKALTSLKKILDVSPDHPEMAKIKYDIARAYYYNGDFEYSIDVSRKWLIDYSENQMKEEIQALLGKNYQAMGDYPAAFAWFLKARESIIDVAYPENKEKQIDSLVIELINSSQITNLTEMLKIDYNGIYTPYIHRKSALLYMEENQLQKARESAMSFVLSTNDQAMVNAGRELLETIYRRIGEFGNIKRTAIGCLLPLKGQFALYGQELLNGIQLGMDIFNRSEANEIELIIINTNGTVEDTVAGIDTLVHQEKVMAILGPLASKPASAAVKKAQELGVPIITFTQKADISKEGDMVFRNFLTPSKEIDILLNKSINDMGMKRFGIFYPDTPYGKYLMNLFWDRVEEMNCEITAVESYQPGETDFAEGIKKMVGLYYPRPESVTRMLEALKVIQEKEESDKNTDTQELTSEDLIDEEIPDHDMEATEDYPELGVEEMEPEAEDDETVEEIEEEEPEPIVDFDAVFIPDDYRNIALIAPQFPFYSVFNVPFLGTSWGFSDELIETTGSYIQGAIFPAGFFIDSESENVKEFVKDYRENYESDPGIFAANGYDTIRLIIEILKDIDVRTRLDFQKALFESKNFIGVTGKNSFDETGDVEKDPLLLTVYGRRLQVLH